MDLVENFPHILIWKATYFMTDEEVIMIMSHEGGGGERKRKRRKIHPHKPISTCEKTTKIFARNLKTHTTYNFTLPETCVLKVMMHFNRRNDVTAANGCYCSSR